MKTLEQATTRELEIAQVRLAIAETDVGIARMETALAAMRQKQTARHREIAIQETLARCSNRQAHESRRRMKQTLPSPEATRQPASAAGLRAALGSGTGRNTQKTQ